jgi:hypothetical protein
MDAPIVLKNKYMLKEWRRLPNLEILKCTYIGRGSGTVYKKYRFLKSDYSKVP